MPVPSAPSSFQRALDEAMEHHRAGRIDRAASLYRAVLAEERLHPDALHMLGVIAQQKGNAALALSLIEAALAVRPGMAQAWHNRALVLQKLGRTQDALLSEEHALGLDPSFTDALGMAGYFALKSGDEAKARAFHERAVAVSPDDAKAHADFALFLLSTGDLGGAHREGRAAEKIDPARIAMTLGNTLKAAGYPDLALPCYRSLLRDPAQAAAARVNEALAHLQMGDFAQGWPLWEQRPDSDPAFAPIPFWQGQRVGHLLLHEDQGLGDVLQGARYLPLLRSVATSITLHVAAPLKPLLAAHFPDMTVLTPDDPVPAADARVRFLSLPHHFRTGLDAIPAPHAYLHAQEAWRAPWRERLSAVPRPRIGLVWGGNPDNLNDRNRSIPFALTAPLRSVAAGRVVCLQLGAQKAEADNPGQDSGMFDAAPWMTDFAATAGLLAELDLLISVDTAVVHLAGALGRPVWLPLCFDPDWRWMLGRDDSPWYPSCLRLFRQSAPRDWAPVIAAMADALRAYVNGGALPKPAAWQAAPLQRHPQALKLPDIASP